MDFLFSKAGFVEVFIVMQFGGFVGSLLLLIPKKYRETIFDIKNLKVKKNKDAHGTAVFVANKALSAVGALLLNYAIAIGSVTIVNSLQVVQYAFVLILTLILTRNAPHLISEETHKSVLIQKGAALLLTAIGLAIIA
jgi:hypothetical protein